VTKTWSELWLPLVLRIKVRRFIELRRLKFPVSKNLLLQVGKWWLSRPPKNKQSSGLAVFTKAEKCYTSYWNIERAMDRTDCSTWKDLPTSYADSGKFSVTGWIPKINVFSISVGILIFCFTTVMTTIRIETIHERDFIA